MLEKNFHKTQLIFWLCYISYGLLYQYIAYPGTKAPIAAIFFHYASYMSFFYGLYFGTQRFISLGKCMPAILFIYFVFGLASFIMIQYTKYYLFYGVKNFVPQYYLLQIGELFLVGTFAFFFSIYEYTQQLNYKILSSLQLNNNKTLLLNARKQGKEKVVKCLDKILKDTSDYTISPMLLDFKELVNFLLNNTHKALIPVTEEIENLKRYLNLYHLRFDNRKLFNLNISGQPNQLAIPHKTILTLVENCIKHGDLRVPVSIDILFETESFKVKVRNKIKKTTFPFKSTNIGLENLKTRLQLHLGDRHSFEVYEDGGWFEVVVGVWEQ